MKLKHKIALFIVYFLVYLVSIAIIDYYALYIIPAWIVVSSSLALAAISTIIHIKSKTKTQADELAKEIEEIL